MAVTHSSPTRYGPRAPSRRAFRFAAALPEQPAGVQALAAIAHARQQAGRLHEWDARLETSAIAVLAYLWRRGRAEKWAGCDGSARYACSLAQLVIGLAPIMGWRNIPDRRDLAARARFVRAHRKSVQRWLDWLQAAGLVSHTPQQDEEGFWWRTIITLHACPEIPPKVMHEAIERRSGWNARETRRTARGRQRDLTAILRRARLTRAQKRARSAARRRELAHHAERQRVRQAVADSLERASKTHLTHPCGAETTSRVLSETSQVDETNRGITRTQAHGTSAKRGSEEGDGGGRTRHVAAGSRSDIRWEAYHEIARERWYGHAAPRSVDEQAALIADADACWAPMVRDQQHRLQQLVCWPADRPAPARWRLIEAWTVAAHGPQMAAAGGFRLAFWCEERDHHGPRLDRALARYERYADARPPEWPASPIAALARFLAEHVARQEDGPAHGMAYDIARFNEITKRMAAYHHCQRANHLERASTRARRRQQIRELAEQVNQRFRFRLGDDPAARLRTARDLLDSNHSGHQDAGRALYAAAQREQRLQERDARLLADRHPGLSDGRYLAACRHAEQWGLQAPPATANTRPQ